MYEERSGERVSRGLGLTVHDLRNIASALEKLAQSGVVTDNIRVGSHRVVLRRDLPHPAGDQRDTPTYVITAIEPYGLDPIKNHDPYPYAGDPRVG